MGPKSHVRHTEFALASALMQNTVPTWRDARLRTRDTLERLARERDIWVSTAHPGHGPHQVPLWFWWDGESVWMCTAERTVTARNAQAEPRVRLALPDTADVVLLSGEAESFPARDVPGTAGDGFAAKFGWDPRKEEAAHVYLRVRPTKVLAWRGEAEHRGRVVLREGVWVDRG